MTISNRNKALLLIPLCLMAFSGYYVVDHVFPYIGIKPWRMVPAENSWRFPLGYAPENYGLTGKKISIKTPDGITLSAWLIDSNSDTTFATVVQLHGISNCKESNFPRARILADSGYASLLLDLRAHGESEGEFCTFGFYEKNDLKAVADTLQNRFPHTPLAIWGASLGGAIALQAMAVEPRYRFGIVESTFDEYPRVVEEYGADYMFGLRPKWLLRRVLQRAGDIAHFDPFAVLPVKSAALIDRPVLFLHGDKDARIPMSFNKRNFDAVQNAEKQWVPVLGAGHNNLWVKDGPSLKTVLSAFLKARNIGQ
jgi:pimeloyl-ACP methyl ester carboxylesterase